MRPFISVEVEEGGQTGLQLTHLAELVEIYVLTFYTVPLTFVEDFVEGTASASLADPNVGSEQALKASNMNCSPCSELNIWGRPLLSARRRALSQMMPSSVMGSCQAST